jgi:hypothetical protein
MWKLLSPEFQKTTGGRAEFDDFWKNTVIDIDAVISPGLEPKVDSKDPDSIWVQVAWRREYASSKKPLEEQSYDLRWFEVLPKANGLLIQQQRNGTPAKLCSSKAMPYCAQADQF